MPQKRLFRRWAPTRPLAKAGNVEVVGFKYWPHMLVALAALVAVYYFMGWELP
jgi:hypothetical protein